jgi:hypothetical protein
MPAKRAPASITDVGEAIAWLERHGKRSVRDGMGRYGIVAPRAFGVSMKDVQALGKRIGRNHALADGLWKSGVVRGAHARRVRRGARALSVAEMNRWCKDFDNWANLRLALLPPVRPVEARARAHRRVGGSTRGVRPPRGVRAARVPSRSTGTRTTTSCARGYR